MSCPAPEQLAAAATEGDDAVLAHAADCAACLDALADQGDVRSLARKAPPIVLTQERREAMAAEVMAGADRRAGAERIPVLTRERRDAMAAELLAKADELPVPTPITSRRRTVALVVAGLAAAAAIVAFVVARDGSERDVVDRTALTVDRNATDRNLEGGTSAAAPRMTDADRAAADRAAATSTELAGAGSGANGTSTALAGSASRPSITTGVGTPKPRPTAMLAGSGDYERDASGARASRDVVRLRGGELTVDSTGSRPVEIVNGTTSIAATKARFKVIAIKGVVSSVAVFAGSAEVTVDGHRVIVEAGTVWERDVSRDDALAAFRTGWTALRAGDNAAAIEAFDRATDATVAEDAAYWSAIASERVGDTAGAVRRYRELLSRFPATTRATEARAAIERLAP